MKGVSSIDCIALALGKKITKAQTGNQDHDSLWAPYDIQWLMLMSSRIQFEPGQNILKDILKDEIYFMMCLLVLILICLDG